jgi:bacterioferritin-associated ferredoxin
MDEWETQLDEILMADRGTNYCAKCLARAAELTADRDTERVVSLMRKTYYTLRDRTVEMSVCGHCKQTALVVRVH